MSFGKYSHNGDYKSPLTSFIKKPLTSTPTTVTSTDNPSRRTACSTSTCPHVTAVQPYYPLNCIDHIVNTMHNDRQTGVAERAGPSSHMFICKEICLITRILDPPSVWQSWLKNDAGHGRPHLKPWYLSKTWWGIRLGDLKQISPGVWLSRWQLYHRDLRVPRPLPLWLTPSATARSGGGEAVKHAAAYYFSAQSGHSVEKVYGKMDALHLQHGWSQLYIWVYIYTFIIIGEKLHLCIIHIYLILHLW
jgi:hypothetical protein